MNKEKAKEIVIKGESFKLEKDKSYQLEEIISLSTAKWKEFHEAKCYLKTVEKFRGVVDSLNKFIEAGNEPLKNSVGTFWVIYDKAKIELAKLEKDV